MKLLVPSLFALPVLARAIGHSPHSAHPGSHTICHDQQCYTSVFVPTDTFQVVHDDQEVPGGLHYRINLETGLKEAKLMESASETKSHDAKSLAVVPGQEAHDARVPPAERKKKAFRPNRGGVSGGALQQFTTAQATLEGDASCSARVQSALDELEELVHELEFGLKVVETTVLQNVVKLLSAKDSACRGKAALVLGSALRNNANAHEALDAHNKLPQRLLVAIEKEKDADVMRMLLYALSATLSPEGHSMHGFASADGHAILATVFDAGSPSIQGKIAALIEDHFVVEKPHAVLAMQQGINAGYASKAKQDEALGGWCLAFQSALLDRGMDSVDAREKLLSAVSGIKRHNPNVCQASQDFIRYLADESVGSSQRRSSPSLGALARSARGLFGHRLSARKLAADRH